MQPRFEVVTIVVGIIVGGLLLGDSLYRQLLALQNPAEIAALLVTVWYGLYAFSTVRRAHDARTMGTKINEQQRKINTQQYEIDGLFGTIRNEAPASRHTIPVKMRHFVLKRDKYTCLYCGEKGTETRDPDGQTWHIDHLHPVSKGGINHPANLAAACSQCNFSKGNKSAAAYFRIKAAQIRARRYMTD